MNPVSRQEDLRERAMAYPFATERLSPSAFINAGHCVREDVMDYNALVEGILALQRESVNRAALAVNHALVLRSWTIGAYLVEFEQNGFDRAAYGIRLIERVARDLKARNIRGLGASMLKNCRQFYRLYPQIGRLLPALSYGIQMPRIRQSVIGEFDATPHEPMASARRHPSPLAAEQLLRLSWTHFTELIGIEDRWKRAFYENECLNGNWSVRQLQRQMGSLLYERIALSTDKQAVIEAARRQATAVQTNIADLIRDPYVLEFAGLAERPRYRESELEGALLDHLQTFLLELGTGFCFEARQKRITVGNEHDHLDLVFYHRRLRCHLLIDLKIRAFKHGDAGQMNFYLNYWKANELEHGDNPPVGLLLCSDRSATRVQYATAGLDHQQFVSRYLLSLPSEEHLRNWMEADRAAVESAAAEDLARDGDGDYGGHDGMYPPMHILTDARFGESA